MKLNTVNVIEVTDILSVSQVFSYTNDKEGNMEAAQMFASLGKENGMRDDELAEAFESGYWNDGGAEGYSVYIKQSS